MKLAKSLLLGAASGLMGVTLAHAADLPSKAPIKGIQYVKICDAYGAGYFYIPGTDTCLKVGGQIRAEYQFQNVRSQYDPISKNSIDAHAKNMSSFHSRLEVREESRTQTAWGVLRTVGYAEFDQSSLGGSSSSIDKAYLQWAGITAGYAQSMFDFYADDAGYSGIRDSDATTTMLAYTYTGPGGISATVSAEDPVTRRWGGNAGNGGITGVGLSVAGSRAPDLVGNIRWDQNWGALQASGAGHESNLQNNPSVLPGSIGREPWGWAAQVGAKINVPMLAPGDVLWVQGAMGQGALSYVLGGAGGSVVGGFGGFTNSGAGVAESHGDVFGLVDSHGVLHAKQNRAYSVLGALEHYWTPTIEQDVYGGYGEIDPSKAVRRGGDWQTGFLSYWREYRVGTMLQWQPVSGFKIGIDGMYAHVNQSLAHANGVAASSTVINGHAFKKDYDSYSGRIRLDRVF